MSSKSLELTCRRILLTGSVVFLLALLSGCATGKAVHKEPAGGSGLNAGETKRIEDIFVSESDGSINVHVRGNTELAYTSIKQPYPLGVFLYFKDTSLDPAVTSLSTQSDILGQITAEELNGKGVNTKVTIELKKDVPYRVEADGKTLVVVFEPTAESLPEEAAAAPESSVKSAGTAAAVSSPKTPTVRLNEVIATQAAGGTDVLVKATGSITDYKYFTVPAPPRIVFDLFRVELADVNGQQSLSSGGGASGVKRVRYFGYSDRIRLVVDTESEFLENFTAAPIEDGLRIRIAKAPAASKAAEEQAVSDASETSTPAASVSAKPAWVNRVDFSSEGGGRSAIVIGTDRAVEYKVKRQTDDRLVLKLLNTRIPDHRQRALITTRFESAVNRISPIQPSDGIDSMIVVELREMVPYYIEQTDDLLFVHFEPSSIPPQPFEEANLPPWKKLLDQVTAESDATVEPDQKDPGTKLAGSSRYTGEKIALDFFDTDIKNVFRIIKEISGKNLAIDKDVSGKVTLSLEKPVPWDQVLDLVLKMNGLGMVYEGDIIRIATQKNIKKEKAEQEAELAAAIERKKSQLALEPLLTEYIPINYANAAKDIKPHLDKILTKGRGQVTIDSRNNQVIITDVATVIDQAKQIVKRIDKVTPQVLIEARIVEVTDDFSTEVGIEWDLEYGVQGDDPEAGIGPQRGYSELGGTYGIDSAMNFPAPGAGSSVGFNFTRLAGTNLIINARINALETQGEGRVISAPKIVTLDNQKAKIKQGLEYPYLERDDSGGSSVKFKNVDLLLEVTPHITPDNRISMSIFITKNDVAQLVDGVPALSTNEAESEILVNDGDTIVIGGIMKNTTSFSKSNFPGFSKIPVLSFLFGNSVQDESKNELLIFLTPKVVRLDQQSS